MTFRDTWVTCEECGKEYVFTVEEQRRQADMGLEPTPALCPKCQQHELLTGEQTGLVKWFDLDKGYGFIVQRSGNEIFFHRNSIVSGDVSRFQDGASVSYEVEEAAKGPQAVNVRLAQGE